MSIVFTFPGQGAQRPEMLQTLPKHSQVADVVEQAQSFLGRRLDKLDSALALQDTVNVQLSLLISGVAWGRYLQAQDLKPDYVLGLSIGAYPAAVVAGILSFQESLRLVQTRAELMKAAYPSGYGMLAINGAGLSQVQGVVEVLQGDGYELYLANLNGPNQFVLAGQTEALTIAADKVRSKGVGSSVMLDVAVPSHCQLLEQQAQVLQGHFETVSLHDSSVRYVSAAKARVLRQEDAIKQDLAFNMAQQLHWHDSCQMLVERGLKKSLEMPPGATLTGLFRKLLSQGRCYGVEATKLETLLFDGSECHS